MAAQIEKDRARFWREPSFGGVDLLSAHFHSHAFARHAHDEFVIAIFDQGAERFEAAGASQVSAAGAVLVIAPGVSHTGSAATSDGWTYRSFYPRAETVLELRNQMFQQRRSRLFTLPLHQIKDRRLYHMLSAAHRAFETGASRLESQSRMLSAVARLLCQVERVELPPPRSEAPAVRRAKDYLEAHFAHDIGIEELAAIIPLSASYLMRSFRRELGVSVHAYLTQVRLRHARDLLVQGEPAVSVAAAVGFVDQSHLIRRFKGTYGTTPGGYARESRLVRARA